MAGGRPISWTPDRPEIGEMLIRLSMGETMTDILKGGGMPDWKTVWNMIDRDPEFFRAYTRARSLQAHAFADEIASVARATTPEEAHAKRVHVDALKWLASKSNRDAYGDKTTLEITSPDGACKLFAQILVAMTADQLLIIIRAQPEAEQKKLFDASLAYLDDKDTVG